MSIRRTLLLAFLLAALTPVLVVTGLSYRASRLALEHAIKTGLHRDAESLMRRVDTTLFERLEDLQSWSDLEVMQEANVGDIDKRLAHFLYELKASYGNIYTELYFESLDGHVVASSTSPNTPLQRPTATKPWRSVSLPGGDVKIDRLAGLPGNPRGIVLPMHIRVMNRFTGKRLGRLIALFNWHEVQTMLGTDDPDHSPHLTLLLDQSRQIIASRDTGTGNAFKSGTQISGKLPDGVSGTFATTQLDSSGASYLVGYATSSGYQQFSGLGWRALVAQPAVFAYAPIRQLLTATLVVLLVTSLVAIALAVLIARRIAGPIMRLAKFTRRFKQDQRLRPHPPEGSREARALNRAFREMMDSLSDSRQQLIRASKLATVGEMAATMAHEVRTPLGIIHSSAQMLAKQAGPATEGREMLDFILGECERLNRLVTLLLECGRPKTPVLVEMDIQQCINQVNAMLASRAESKHITLEHEPNAAPAIIQGDPEQIKQVFLNLTLNAIQILPQGGTIGVKTIQDHEWIHTDVYDDGPGIATADRMRVFDPFFSTRQGGFGLGLSVVHQIVNLHGGTVEVADSKAGGACFRICLPRKKP